MNKVYTLVWDPALGQIVVASELAKGRTKGGRRIRRAVPLTLALAGTLGALPASAGTYTDANGATCSTPDPVSSASLWTCTVPNGTGGVSVISNVPDNGSGSPNFTGLGVTYGAILANSIAVGSGATAQAPDSIAMGTNANAGGGNHLPDVAIGAGATAVGATINNEGSVAIGRGARAISVNSNISSVAIGDNAVATWDGMVSIGPKAGYGRTLTNGEMVLLGNQAGAADAAHAAATLGYQTIAIGNGAGYNSNANYRNVFIGSASGRDSVSTSNAVSGQNIGIGDSAFRQAVGDSNLAFGTMAMRQATGNRNIAVGADALRFANGSNNVAVGNNAASALTGDSNIAIGTSASGNGALVNTSYTISIGDNSKATAADAVALGKSAAATGLDSIAMGTSAIASGTQSISIGYRNSVTGNHSGAFGDPNVVTGSGSYAFGNNNTIANNNTFVLGTGVITSQDNSVVLGNLSTDRTATTETGVTIAGTTYTFAGQGSAANGVVSVGGVGTERQVINVAAGNVSATSTDAINGSQLYAANQAIQSVDDRAIKYDWTDADLDGVVDPGEVDYTNATLNPGGAPTAIHNVAAGVAPTDAVNVSQLTQTVAASATHYYSVNDGGTQQGNYNNDGATGSGSLAAGAGASASSIGSIAIGLDAASGGFQDNVAIGHGAVGGTTATDDYIVAIGSGASATDGDFTVAIGGNSVATLGGTAVGGYSSATGSASSALGQLASASGDFSLALGALSSATAASGVALGSESVADANANGVGYVPTGAGTAQASAIAATTKGTLAPVSVGNIDATRQIQNVAAGTLDSDAVNVAQLKAVATTVQGVDDRAVKYDWTDTDGDGVVDPGEINYTSVTMNPTGAPTTIHNVAAGVAPTDAVNVSQLTQVVAASAIHYYSVNDNGVQQGNYNNNGATGINSMALGTNAQSTGAQSVAIGNGATASDPQSVALGSGSVTAPVVATTSGVIAGTSYTYAGTAPVGTVSVGAAGAERTITNVAAGRVSATSTDAVNGSQLYATNQAIDKLNTQVTNIDDRVTVNEGDITNIKDDIVNLDDRVTNIEDQVVHITDLQQGADGMFQVSQEGPITKPQATGTNSSAGGNGAVASGTNTTAVGNQAKATGNNSTAVGTGATASANNSTALGQGATASHANSVALGAGSQTTRGAQTGYNAAYVGTSSSTGEVNIGGRTMTGVAAGIQDTDAVNVSQLRAGVNYAIDQSKAYTDQAILGVQNDIWAMDRGYRGATASAMAMAALPQPYTPGKSMLSVGFGGYQGEAGMAIGLSGTTENGRWVYKAQASGNTTRDWGFSVGAGIQW